MSEFACECVLIVISMFTSMCVIFINNGQPTFWMHMLYLDSNRV